LAKLVVIKRKKPRKRKYIPIKKRVIITLIEGEKDRNFENFKSNICHDLKSAGDLPFLKEVIKQKIIENYYEKEYLPECFYLLGMVDYLCHIHNIPYKKRYDYIREYRMEQLIFPLGVECACLINNNNKAKLDAIEQSIPEFLRYNIVEWGIRDVY